MDRTLCIILNMTFIREEVINNNNSLKIFFLLGLPKNFLYLPSKKAFFIFSKKTVFQTKNVLYLCKPVTTPHFKCALNMAVQFFMFKDIFLFFNTLHFFSILNQLLFFIFREIFISFKPIFFFKKVLILFMSLFFSVIFLCNLGNI